jgi:hypothetical protein
LDPWARFILIRKSWMISFGKSRLQDPTRRRLHGKIVSLLNANFFHFSFLILQTEIDSRSPPKTRVA